MENEKTVLPTDKQARKNVPMMRGLLDYFPNALAAVAEVSRVANEQHNPGEEMHWAWGKSNDHADCIVRHLVDRGKIDTDNLAHSAKVAWRALALAEEELVAAGATPGRAVWMPPKEELVAAGATPGRAVWMPPKEDPKSVAYRDETVDFSRATYGPRSAGEHRTVYDIPVVGGLYVAKCLDCGGRWGWGEYFPAVCER